ncbi:MAG: PQQ-dependent sugar dehydrogenase [Pseudohongiella sp.]|nr:PQQ-dependent sugar dehydrogenase [Pseudohongiella sp.]
MNKLTVSALLSVWVTVVFAQPAHHPAHEYHIDTITDALEHPWSVAFLPDERMLVTERPGRLRLIDESGLVPAPISGLPEIFVSGQAGLFDVLLAQDFASSQTIYLSYAHGDMDANSLRIAHARFDGQQLVDLTPVFTALPAKSGDAHSGGRMAWLDDGTLVVGTGDGFYFREDAQRLDTHHAKIIRINRDGTVPPDNPFVGRSEVRPEIYSYGHRHVQALVPSGDTLYAHEHGPRGGDELNRIVPGANYGWPIISYGRDYSRAAITPFTQYTGMEQPVLHWTPSIAPAGMTLYQSSRFPQWQGSLFVAALAEESVRRVPLDASGVPGEQEILFTELNQRIRDVRSGPDGALYLLTDEPEGQLLRVIPLSEMDITAGIESVAEGTGSQ